MSHLSIFFNTRVENSGALAWVGDKGLAPFRYLCNGKTLHIENRESNQSVRIDRVALLIVGLSHSAFLYQDASSITSFIKTALAITFLVPGLLLGTFFKGMAYLFSDVRTTHRLAKEHFTPIHIKEIGSVSEPIRTRDELKDALLQVYMTNLKSQRISNLIIHGDGNLTIGEAPCILLLNPKKLILDGVKLVHEISTNPCFDAAISAHKWQVGNSRTSDGTFVKIHDVNTVKEAADTEAPRKGRFSSKRYHMIFNILNPQST